MQNNKLTSELKQTGLSDKEAQVYAALVELGGAYPSRLAEYTKLNRSTVYKILEDLSVNGLISSLQKGKKLYYQVEKPDRLVQYSKKKLQKATRGVEKAEDLIPELLGLFALSPSKPKVRFAEGVDGVILIYEDHVDPKNPYKEMLGYSNANELLKFLSEKFMRDYVKKKEKMGIITKGILPVSSKSYNKKAYRQVSKKTYPDLRFISDDKFPFKSEITVYGNNRVSVINFEKKGLVGVIIEDKTIHDMMRMIFNLAWDSAGKYSK
ncbi:hypothetical protein HQ571_02745 [Candidatus Kuenenbacteria bacterium]|nr:hypothetical protein [Candidatus Kuenenbacteria bacterium]